MAQRYRWIALGQPLPRHFELLPNMGLKVTQDLELPMRFYTLVLKAGTVYEPGQSNFRKLAILWNQGCSRLKPARLVLDLDPVPEADIAARLRELVLHPPQTEPIRAPHAGPGPPRTAERHNWTLEYLIQLLKDGYKKARSKYPEKHYINSDDIAEGAGYSRKYLYEALNTHGYNFRSIRRFIID